MEITIKPRFRSCIFCALRLLLVVIISSPAYAENTWNQLTTDLDMKQVSVPTSAIFNSELLAFRTALKKFKLATVPASDYGLTRETVKSLALLSKAQLLINANFFDEQGEALGLVINRGLVRNSFHRGGNTLTGIFSVSHLGVSITHRSDRLPSSVLEAVQAGPRLILHGQRLNELHNHDRSRRSALCIDRQQRLLIFISSGLVGLTFEELQSALLEPELDCQEAINLDGGGSSQLFVNLSSLLENSEQEDIFITGRDPIPVALGLFPIAGN